MGTRRLIKLVVWAGIVLSVRGMLFQNSWIWKFHEKHLSPDEIDWRPYGVVEYQRIKHSQDDPNGTVKYLALGSSQVERIFSNEAFYGSGGTVISFPFFQAVDLNFYRQEIIKRYRPQNVILYLSELDLARRLDIKAAVRLDPFPGRYYISFVRKLLNPKYSEFFSWRILIEPLICWFSPEYKYGFLFQGYLRKILKEPEALGEIRTTQVPLARRYQTFLQTMKSDHWLKERWERINFSFLNDFLQYCERKKTGVIILEGQYHPNGRTRHNLELNRSAVKRLRALDQRYKYVTFIPRSLLYQFDASEFTDGSHVNAEGAGRFTEQFLGMLNEK